MNITEIKILKDIFIEAIENIIEPMLSSNDDMNIINKDDSGHGKDYFTKIDTASQSYIIEKIMNAISCDTVIGEEGFEEDVEGNITKLSQGYSIALDPLDGSNRTVRYLQKDIPRDLLNYGIQGVILKNGTPVGGIIVTVGNKTVEYAYSFKNQKAFFGQGFLDKNNNIKITHECPLTLKTPKHVIISTYATFNDNYKAVIDTNHTKGLFEHDSFAPQSAAHESMHFLKGNAEAFIHRQFRAWDHMPAMVIAESMGAKAFTLNGDTPKLEHQRKDGFVLALNREHFQKIRKAFLGDIPYNPANKTTQFVPL